MPPEIHVGAAVAGLVLGAAVIAMRKGTARHRIAGGCYAALLLVVNVAALSLPRSVSGLGAFHVLAILSLATLAAGLVPMWVRPRTERIVAVHGITMCFSYAGLVAAGLSQAMAERFPGQAVAAVTVTSAVTFAVASIAIYTRVPRALAK
jgi:uncharacterized membrane protein